MIRRPAQFSIRVPDPVALLAMAMIFAAVAAGAMERQEPPERSAQPLTQPLELDSPATEPATVREQLRVRLSLFRHG